MSTPPTQTNGSPRTRPGPSEHAPFYSGYIAAVPEGDIVALLGEGGRELDSALALIPASRVDFRYAVGKWSIGDVIGHVIDAERIFVYRALRFARGDTTPLPGFDENQYARAAASEPRSLSDLRAELHVVRESSVRMFAGLSDDAWTRRGMASGSEISVRALAYVVDGHSRHHLHMLRERYSS